MNRTTLIFRHPVIRIAKKSTSSMPINAIVERLTLRQQSRQIRSFTVHPSSVTVVCSEPYYNSLRMETL